MKEVYCAKCGMKLSVIRKAIPGYGRIISIVESHDCADEPIEIDLTPIDIPTVDESSGKNKFIQGLNKLKPSTVNHIEPLCDRRSPDMVKSIAPTSIIDQLKTMQNSTPEHNLDDFGIGDKDEK